MIQAIILLVFLIFLNSVFAGAEIAVLSMNEPKMKEMAEEGDHRAQILMKITEQPAHFMTAIRVTITTAGFLQSAFAASAAQRLHRNANGWITIRHGSRTIYSRRAAQHSGRPVCRTVWDWQAA